MSKVILVASGKGGVGKSTLTANIGAALAQRGSSVVIVDTDIGLRSQDALLGLENSIVYDLIDVVNKECSLEQALHDSPFAEGLKLLPAAQFARARSLDNDRFRKIVKSLRQSFDFVLIDAPAGIEKGFRNLLCVLPDQSILISTPDDLCVRDVERAAQIFEARHLSRPYLIVNRLDNELIQMNEMQNARSIAALIDLPLLGEIPDDPVVYRSLLRKSLFIEYDCPARSAVLRIASRLLGEEIPCPDIGCKKRSFLRRLIHRTPKEVIPLDRH